MSLKSFSFVVTDEYDRKDVKTFLRRCCGLSARILTLAKQQENGITRNGRPVRTIDTVSTGDIIAIVLEDEPSDILPVNDILSVLYEDDHILIVDKPAGMPVHPTKQHQTDTLANVVADHQRKMGEDYPFRALNRLDKDTTGCVVIVKDLVTYCLLKGMIEKEYLALCDGKISAGGTIDLPIALEENSTMKRTVRDNGARAVTHYEPLQYEKDFTVVKLRLETGRTHQIRCHMSAVGHPLLGDKLYGGNTERLHRQALCCKTVVLTHPFSQKEIRVCAGIPDDMKNIIKQAKVR